MIYKLVSCLSVISISAYGNNVKEKYAISTQSFNRPDIPISYKFTNVHDYKRESIPKREHSGHLQSALRRYPVIQYAPLHYDTKSEDHREQHRKTKEVIKSDPTLVNTEQEKPKYNNLEPQPLKEDDNEKQQKYRSFISGHNVEAYTETTGNYLELGVNPYVTRKNYYQKQMVKPPKFVYYQKLENSILNTPNHNNIVGELPANGAYNFIEFLPADFNSYPRKEHKKSLPYAYSLHNQLTQEKQQQTFAHPRIHLNIARNYNIANQSPEARLPPILGPKALALTNLLLNPQNTLMLPVRKVNSILGL